MAAAAAAGRLATDRDWTQDPWRRRLKTTATGDDDDNDWQPARRGVPRHGAVPISDGVPTLGRWNTYKFVLEFCVEFLVHKLYVI